MTEEKQNKLPILVEEQKEELSPNRLIRTLQKYTKRRRTPTQEFSNFLDFMNKSEKERNAYMSEEIKKNYKIWSEYFNILKDEFNSVWDFFETIQADSPDWKCESRFPVNWKAVAHLGEAGYAFSSSISKTKAIDSPLIEKGVSVSFAHEESGGGIGDELWLGRSTPISDELVGMSDCNAINLHEKYKASKKLVNRLSKFKIIFILNHPKYGQESTQLPTTILEKHSLVHLAEQLFLAVNNDMVQDFKEQMNSIQGEKKLLS